VCSVWGKVNVNGANRKVKSYPTCVNQANRNVKQRNVQLNV